MIKLRQKPMPIDEHNCYFEESKGISLIHEVYNGSKFLQTDIILIPWKRLLESVRRKYMKEKKNYEKKTN